MRSEVLNLKRPKGKGGGQKERLKKRLLENIEMTDLSLNNLAECPIFNSLSLPFDQILSEGLSPSVQSQLRTPQLLSSPSPTNSSRSRCSEDGGDKGKVVQKGKQRNLKIP